MIKIDSQEAMASEATFAEAFAPLAHHLFPDGCPSPSSLKLDQNTHVVRCSLPRYWPRRRDRKIFSPLEARQSIQQLRSLASSKGFCPAEILALAIVACATLPRDLVTIPVKEHSKSDLSAGTPATLDAAVCESVGEGSKLVDGTTRCFVDIVRCLVPSFSCSDEELSGEECVPAEVIRMLLSAAASNKCDGHARRVVLRFLTLLVRSGCLRSAKCHANERDRNCCRQVLSSLYSVPFSMLHDSMTVADAVRLLHAITRKQHVQKYRARRLREIYNESIDSADRQQWDHDRPWLMGFRKGKPSGSFSSLLLLLQLYARYDPDGCGQHFPHGIKLRAELSRYLRFPDEDWQNDFDTKLCSKPLLTPASGDGADCYSSSSVYNATDTQWSRSILRTLDSLEDAFDGVRSMSWSILRKEDRGGKRARHVRASDILSDEAMRHLILLSNADFATKNSSPPADICTTEIVRLRVCLPYMLYDEWYDEDKRHVTGEGAVELSDEHRSRRSRLIHSLSSFASHVGSIPPEADAFVIHEVLPSYDGTEIYETLLHEVVPLLTISPFHEFKHNVLRRLARIYPTALPKIKHAIVSAALTGLLRRNGTMANSARYSVGYQSVRELSELVLWTDNLIMTGLIAEQASDSEGSELILLSALDFFDVACDCSHCCNVVFFPTPPLIFRMLLSDTALCIDRVCYLLVRYKSLLEEFKKRNMGSSGSKAHVNNSFVELVGEVERYIAIFNYYVWDYCSALWRCPDLSSLTEDQRGNNAQAMSNSILFTDLSLDIVKDLQSLPKHLKVQFALSITHGAAFSGFAVKFLEQYFEGKREPSDSQDLSPDLLTGTTKVKYLDYLRDVGFSGLHLFLTTFVGSLSAREAKKKRKRSELN